MNAEAVAARLAATFNVDIDVLSSVRTPRPSGGAVVAHGLPDFTLRGRLRPFSPESDGAVIAGQQANDTLWTVRTGRYSQVTVGRRLVVRGSAAGSSWEKTLDVLAVRGPKSVYTSDVFVCREVR